MIAASVIDAHALLQLLWSATAASLTVCVSFVCALRALASAGAARREGRRGAAVAYVVLAGIPAAICLGAIVVAVLVLVTG
jgi:hypothetical protein